jgi:hypothetical protein
MRLILQTVQLGEKEMKTTLSIIGIVVLSFFLLTAAGSSQAGGLMHKSSGQEKSAKQGVETVYAPEFEEDEYGDVIETGALPNPPRLLESDEVPDWLDEPSTE